MPEMNKEIVVYKIPTSRPDLPGVAMSHVWLRPVDEPRYNWNCYGRGKDNEYDEGAKPLTDAPVHGNIAWMSAVYGYGSEGQDGKKPAAGMYELREGVCQNVANRMLAMTEENADVSKADANELVVLAFGKYGFGVAAFESRLRETAAELNARNPDVVVVTGDELERVLKNIQDGQGVAGEVENLIDDLPPLIRQTLLAKVSGRKREAFVREYAGYQQRREAWYEDMIGKNVSSSVFVLELRKFLMTELTVLLEKLRKCIGTDLYDAVVKVLPVQASHVLIALGHGA